MVQLFFSMFLAASVLFPFGDKPIPGDPFIIVNKESNELAYLNENEIVKVIPVATGRSSELTPEGTFMVIVKAENPYYRKKNIPGGREDNPLGTRWIGFDAQNTDGRIYGLHGTNRPSSIGEHTTAGCVRLQNNEVEKLFDEVPYGTKILITSSAESFLELGRKAGALTK
ncbi:L,D-transpeptidase [Pseudalkalibacillus hwajinpoensis]|uniref:L,D-transpeptidase n=1 Tax=Guptibacillus hwajinpoensis TaxID=208199 RepID=UPI00325B9013